MEGEILQGEALPENGVDQDVIEVDESTTETVETTEPERKKPWYQARFDEMAEQRRAVEARELEARQRADRLERMLSEQLTQKVQPEAPKQPEFVEPKPEQFQTYEEFLDARADYRADLKIKQWEQSRVQGEQAAKEAVKVAEFIGRVETARTKLPDFDAVAFNPTLPVTDAMSAVLNLMEDGPEVLYALGQNPSEAARIASLPPNLAAVELGKFAYKASLPQPRRQTNAPAPIEPIGGGVGAALGTDPNKMTGDEFRVWRNQQLGRK